MAGVRKSAVAALVYDQSSVQVVVHTNHDGHLLLFLQEHCVRAATVLVGFPGNISAKSSQISI